MNFIKSNCHHIDILSPTLSEKMLIFYVLLNYQLYIKSAGAKLKHMCDVISVIYILFSKCDKSKYN